MAPSLGQLWLALPALLALHGAISEAQIQLFAADGGLPFSTECNAALSANLSCNLLETGGSMYHLTANLTADMLDQMCTDECKSSIATYRQAVEAACANDEYHSTNNATSYIGSSGVFMPVVLPDMYITNFHQRCLKDANGNYCALQLQSSTTLADCDECSIRMFQQELKNGYFYNEDLAERYTSLTSSCGFSNLELPTPSSVIITRQVFLFCALPSITPASCPGRSVAIKPGDTCDTFAAANNVSTWRLLIDNGLQSGCMDFPTEGSLCVIGSCQTHNVTATDTCPSIALQYGITITQFRTWNQVLDSRCTNLNVLVGHQACVSYPGNATSVANPYVTTAMEGTATAAEIKENKESKDNEEQ
ncbi:LysM peptidoglycan-binding domain-containing protein [Aspergillus thermomutatus]|uniref:LysM domain-containing protein n=1 Tax=Aspergillus thermomutatus TaxID=41047 RepID=A0A397H2T7_ASPTH|nr:uncharacterized protein CDV56_108050 [Aspergillus thermomutatus]RHZ56168.1 hypothetical protein CDV56_108050 [Aspergillus thermomutatus]